MAKKRKKEKKDRFILEFGLKTEKWQEDIIDKRLEAGRQMYNALLSTSLKRWKELKKTRKYRALIASLDHDKEHPEHDKPIWDEIDKLRDDAGLSQFGLSNMMTPIRQHFRSLVNVHIAQKLSLHLWNAYEKLFYSDGKELHFKKYGQVNALEGKNNKTGIVFKPDIRICKWGNLTMPVVVDEANSYEVESLMMPIAYCGVKRQFVRGKRKYYLFAVFKGQHPAKRRNSDGRFTQKLGHGDVGIDIGTSTVAFSSASDVKIFELADKAQGLEREKFLLRRRLNRSRRAMNPDNYNPDGTTKKGRLHWLRSKRYLKQLMILKEIYRKQAAVRKFQHEQLTNFLLQKGDSFYVEKMSFKGLQKKSQKTEKSEKTGKFKCKKRFGKSLANRAPATFLSILERKLNYLGKQLIRINTVKARASQFNHIDETYKKKKLSQRWNDIDGHRVQRDMYSAFLIMNVNPDLETFNMKKCNSRFENFLSLHDKEVHRLLGNKNLSSIGI